MDVQDKLLFRFLNEDDGTGKLHVRAHCNGFSGDGSAWFSTEDLKEFASALTAFPIPEENPPAIRSGFYRKDNSGEIEQEHLSLRVYPIDRTGHLGVQVRIATEVWPQTRPESQHFVQLEILTTYEPLKRFRSQLKSLVDGAIKEAVLEADLSSHAAG
jgi:hypothetical protein